MIKILPFMKYNWLKPFSFSSIFEFEVDPYMEWLGKKQHTIMLDQTQYSMLGGTLRVCVCVCVMSGFRILHCSFYPVI